MNPRIYVACLASYNAGILHGAWIDALQDPDDLMDEIRTKVLETSPVDGAEEWAIHDYEDFGPIRLSEYVGLEEVSALAKLMVEDGEAFALWYEYGHADGLHPDEWESAFRDAYRGVYDSREDFAREFFEGIYDIPEALAPYVDWDLVGRDLELAGDIWTARSGGFLHVFAS